MRRQPEDLAKLMAACSNSDPAPRPRYSGCTIISSSRATRPPRAVLIVNNKLTMPIRESPSRRTRTRPRSGKSIICCKPVDCKERSGRNSASCTNNSPKSSHSPAISSLVASVIFIVFPCGQIDYTNFCYSRLIATLYHNELNWRRRNGNSRPVLTSIPEYVSTCFRKKSSRQVAKINDCVFRPVVGTLFLCIAGRS